MSERLWIVQYRMPNSEPIDDSPPRWLYIGPSESEEEAAAGLAYVLDAIYGADWHIDEWGQFRPKGKTSGYVLGAVSTCYGWSDHANTQTIDEFMAEHPTL